MHAIVVRLKIADCRFCIVAAMNNDSRLVVCRVSTELHAASLVRSMHCLWCSTMRQSCSASSAYFASWMLQVDAVSPAYAAT